jgi:hypothetical protein
MPVIDEKCRVFGEPLKWDARIATTYCGVRCGVRIFRRRRRTTRETIAR